ncbi:MAG: hypothetical protein JNL04_21405 [Rhodospirillaceae bacterium]|nr:hypothetical protein [Rhodospirillaceae bacterium]
MSNAFEPAINALILKIEDTERKANELRRAVNVLCEQAGQPPRFPDGGGGTVAGSGQGGTITEIKPDTFYGKKQTTAIREYLEMRKARGIGPTKPRDILEALKNGGYQFETKDDETALAVIRNLMRKNNAVFHRLPSGVYGLAAWYPDAKKAKAQSVSDDDEDDTETDADDDGKPDVVVDSKGTATAKKVA